MQPDQFFQRKIILEQLVDYLPEKTENLQQNISSYFKDHFLKYWNFLINYYNSALHTGQTRLSINWQGL